MKKEDLILKWLDNDLTPEEFRELEAMEGFETYRKIIEKGGDFPNPKTVDPVKGLEDLQARMKSAPKVISFKERIRYVAGIAAAIAVLFTAYLFYQQQSQVNFSADLAEHSSISLPDQSQVTLNAQSEISFNEKEWSKRRSLKLKGEAWFKVEKGSAFKVNTKSGWVQVLGTQFNVYNREGIFKVSCYEGAVKVGVGEEEYTLRPGQELLLAEGKLTMRSIGDAHPSWIDGSSSFESIPLAHIFKEIERQYDVTVDYRKQLSSQRFTGVFPHDNLDQALRSVCQPFGLEFKISDDGKNVKISAIEK
ncbi:FecR family protein [Robertkochia flava]|uniref:FecR family protein n=1 Tax=Robertkochia flava TaxID=3447986 RepID=UPI001CCAAC12|nr:FecR domain-containing protein [Robertkochia marina]